MLDDIRGWIDEFAAAAGVPSPSDDTIETLLQVAATAAHSSARQAAPITCWLAAQAGLSPQEAADLARRLAGED